MRFALTLALVLAGCHVTIADSPDLRTTDAAPNPNGDIDAPAGVITDAPPACLNGRRVYLNFEGQVLTQGPSDATTNHAQWMNTPSGQAPPYHAGSATRTADIQAITDGVRAQLANYPIDVVTTRPAAGPYVMIVYGGVAGTVGSNYGLAVNQLDCGDTAKSDVAWIADGVGSTQRTVNFSIGAIGFGLGLTATNTSTDCMCGWANQCTSDNTVACTLTSSIARDPGAVQTCQGAMATQDEAAAFATQFCQ